MMLVVYFSKKLEKKLIIIPSNLQNLCHETNLRKETCRIIKFSLLPLAIPGSKMTNFKCFLQSYGKASYKRFPLSVEKTNCFIKIMIWCNLSEACAERSGLCEGQVREIDIFKQIWKVKTRKNQRRWNYEQSW